MRERGLPPDAQRSGARRRRAADVLRAPSDTTSLPLVATGDIHMHARGYHALQDTLALRNQLAQSLMFPLK
jgi:hypothetical protein